MRHHKYTHLILASALPLFTACVADSGEDVESVDQAMEEAHGAAVASYTIQDDTPGENTGWKGGGVLFEDGTLGGTVTVVRNNGETVWLIHGLYWFYIIPDTLVQACYSIEVVQGTAPVDFFCEVAPVTGTPLSIDLDGNNEPDLMIRITLTGN